MDLNLKNKKVFISGSTKGIGFETATLFLKEGASVIINGRTDKSVNEAISELNNPNVKGIKADFSDDSNINSLIKKLPSDIDILVNNLSLIHI